VIYTAESEIDAARSNTLPKVNCKFSSLPYGGKHAAIGAPEYKKWLLEVIEAYDPLNLRDEVSWNDAFEKMGGSAFSPFIECTREHGCRVNKPTGSWYKGD
jgi:hypothetical protein